VPDPPAAIDRSLMVPVNGRYLLVSEDATDPVISKNLQVIVIDTGTHYEANPTKEYVAYTSMSPDHTSFVLTGPDPAELQAAKLVRLLDGGFIPGTTVRGFEQIRGGMSQFIWTADSRFVAAWRGGSDTEGVDVIDTAGNQRWGGMLASEYGMMADFIGLQFTVWYGPTPSDTQNAIAIVTKEGLPAPTILSKGASSAGLGADGSAWYAGAETPPVLYRIGTYGAAAKPIGGLPAGKPSSAMLPEPSGTSCIVPIIDDSAKAGLWRVYTDGATPVVVGDHTKNAVSLTSMSPDGKSLLIPYLDDPIRSVDVVNLETLERFAVGAATEAQILTYPKGNHFLVEPENEKMLVVGMEGGKAIVTAVTGDAPGYIQCSSTSDDTGPDNRLVIGNGPEYYVPAQLTLLDLSQAAATVKKTITPAQSGAKLSCPKWSTDGKVFAYTEATSASTRVYLVDWSSDAPSEPQVVYETTQIFRLHGLH
jgi:hypothetical protein